MEMEFLPSHVSVILSSLYNQGTFQMVAGVTPVAFRAQIALRAQKRLFLARCLRCAFLLPLCLEGVWNRQWGGMATDFKE